MTIIVKPIKIKDTTYLLIPKTLVKLHDINEVESFEITIDGDVITYTMKKGDKIE